MLRWPDAATRHLSTAGDGKQQGADASTSGSEAASAGTTLKHLLQATTQRIAEGRVGELANVSGNAASAGLAAALEQLLPPPPAAAPSASTAEPRDGGDAADRRQRLGVMRSEAAEMRAAAEGAAAADAAAAAQPLYHRKYGYAALGGAMPSDDTAAGAAAAGAAGLFGSIGAAQPRINPRRKFAPGAVYEPQELNPFSAAAAAGSQRRSVELRPNVAEVMEKADYKNVAFLARWFLSPAGRLLPRKQTRLPVTVHRHVSRQIKLARHMGLMAGEARLDKMHLAAIREQELAEATEAAAAAEVGAVAGGGGGRARPNELLDFGA